MESILPTPMLSEVYLDRKVALKMLVGVLPKASGGGGFACQTLSVQSSLQCIVMESPKNNTS